MEQKISFLLRFGMLGCFVGHGFWGIAQKTGWLKFFLLFGIPENIAWNLMPVVGIVDILMGIMIFLQPRAILIWWAAIWTIFTALLRPMAGMGMSEFFERAGNYGLPIAFLVMFCWPIRRDKAFHAIRTTPTIDPIQIILIEKILRYSLFLLLAGHAGLALFQEHPILHRHASFLGFENRNNALIYFGSFEMLLAFIVLFKGPQLGLMMFVFFFKLFTEILHPISGRFMDTFESIERMGDYIIPLTLTIIYAWQSQVKRATNDTGHAVL